MNTDTQYIQGFNNGYILAKHEPVLLNIISKNLAPNNNYIEGLFEGRDQLEFEKTHEQLLQIEAIRNQSNCRDKELGRE